MLPLFILRHTRTRQIRLHAEVFTQLPLCHTRCLPGSFQAIWKRTIHENTIANKKDFRLAHSDTKICKEILSINIMAYKFRR